MGAIKRYEMMVPYSTVRSFETLMTSCSNNVKFQINGLYFVIALHRFRNKFMSPVLCSISKFMNLGLTFAWNYQTRHISFEISMRQSTIGSYFRYGTQRVTQSYNVAKEKAREHVNCIRSTSVDISE